MVFSLDSYSFAPMSSYVVSARKYRPDSFEAVVGQGHITRTLINEIKSQKLAQAFLFCGPRGVGKTTCARILAKEINREEDGNTLNDLSFNIFELDAASNNSVEDIRNLVEQVRIPPQRGKYKVYIIDEVHMLSNAAFNAFLKTLEEPPAYAIFILATTERHKIIPTILSRCQIFNFERITVPQIVDHLKHIAESEEVKTEEEALHLIAQKSDGAMRDALSLFDQLVSFSESRSLTYTEVLQNLHILDYDYFFRMTNAFYERNPGNALVLFDEILSKGFDGQIFLNGLSSHFRDLLVCKSPVTHHLLEVPSNIARRYVEQATQIDEGFLINALQIADQYDLSYKQSNNQRLHVELVLIRMCHIGQTLDLLAEFKKKRAEPIAADFKTSPKPKPVAPQLKEPPGVIRIGGIKNVMAGKVNPKEVAEEKSEELRLPKEKFADLSTALESLAQELIRLQKASAAATLRSNIAKMEGDVLHLELLQHEFILFEEIKTDLLRFLRTGLGSESLSIEYHLSKKSRETSKPFKAKDKLEAMIHKNPALAKMIKDLDLKLED